ncbi:MAG: ABC transporter ATP-binding protein [Deltaproteobacteria bacterium]|jgi:lipoprotein-releasing system ATP-binding protein|nr:ABC transporter ATP-binding protein [Deltaproteobacteria bacterium]
MNDSPKKLVEIRSLTKTYDHLGKHIEVLKGLDLDVAAGEMCSIVGASGAGKSTFLHVVGTLDAPTSGTIHIDGNEVTGLAERSLAEFRNRTIGFVFQFHHLLPEFSALENTMMPGLIRKMDRAELEQQARDILEEVGLDHRLTHKPGELSGGEQQRVALARALVLKPLLLLADEPTGNLDGRTSDAIHDLFFKLNERLGTTMLLVTHNPSLAERMPRMLLLENGVVRDVGEGAERLA